MHHRCASSGKWCRSPSRNKSLVDPRRRALLLGVVRAGAPPPLALLAQALDDLDHLLARAERVDHLVAHAHGHLLAGVGVEQLLDEQVAHEDAHEDAAVVAVGLLRAVLDALVPQRHAHQPAQPVRRPLALAVVGPAQRVVVERHAVDLGHEQERPVGPVGLRARHGVVYGQEHVCDLGHVGEGGPDALGVVVDAHEKVGHGWSEETDAGLRVLGEDLALQPPGERMVVLV